MRQRKNRGGGARKAYPAGLFGAAPNAAPHVIALRPFLRFWRRQRLHVGSAMRWICWLACICCLLHGHGGRFADGEFCMQ